MKLGKAVRLIEKVIKSEDKELKQIPILLLGPPGIGKTASIRYIANKHGYSFVQEIISRKRPEYLEGIMVPSSTSEEFNGYRIAKFIATDLYRKITESPKTVVLFDEITTASPSLLNAALTILADYEIAGNKLENEVLFIAAGNAISDGTAYVEKLRASVSSRFLVLEVAPDLEYLVQEKLLHKIYAPEVTAFLLSKPEWFYNLAQEDIVGDTTASQITTPRGWEALSRLLIHVKDLSRELVAGVVGTAADDFVVFMNKYGYLIRELSADSVEVQKELQPYVDYLKTIKDSKKEAEK